MKNDIQLYSKGFIFGKEEHIKFIPSNWNKIKIDKYSLFHDPRNEIDCCSNDEYYVALNGIAVDTIAKTINLRTICENIINKISESNVSFYEYLDGLAGNYFIILFNRKKGKTWILADATGMRCINYTIEDKKIIASSHVNLINRSCNFHKTEGIETTGYGYPGDRTPYDNIRRLTPNHILELETRSVYASTQGKKLWKVTDDVAKSIIQNFDIQLNLLSKKYSFMASLSAGIDSRTTLAI